MPVHKYDMGVIGNCSYLAYIDMRADVKWMCLPRFDSSFLFGSLLDEEKGGHFSIIPTDASATSRQYYIPNTNVLCTEFICPDGRFVVKDCAPRMRIHERQFRPLMLVRKIELLEGEPAIRICCTEEVAEHYARIRADLEKRGVTIGGNDLWIAATALAHGATLVTNNTDEFTRVPGLLIEDWTQQ